MAAWLWFIVAGCQSLQSLHVLVITHLICIPNKLKLNIFQEYLLTKEKLENADTDTGQTMKQADKWSMEKTIIPPKLHLDGV